MIGQNYRLGDLIDDYCPRCRLLLNHAVASLVDGEVVKVICQTCHSEHAYRRGEVGTKKPTGGRTTLFDQVLSKAAPSTAVTHRPPDTTSPAQKRKKGATAARYISRHASRHPRKRK